jgi:hypothetical protein
MFFMITPKYGCLSVVRIKHYQHKKDDSAFQDDSAYKDDNFDNIKSAK